MNQSPLFMTKIKIKFLKWEKGKIRILKKKYEWKEKLLTKGVKPFDGGESNGDISTTALLYYYVHNGKQVNDFRISNLMKKIIQEILRCVPYFYEIERNMEGRRKR